MATDIETILLVSLMGVIVFVGYILYQKYKKPDLNEELPEFRDKAMVIGEDGAKIVLEKTTSGPYKTRYKFEDGTIQYYHHRDGYHDLIETNIEQDHLGVNRPVLLERSFVLRHAYKDRRVGMHLLNQTIGALRDGITVNQNMSADEAKHLLTLIAQTDKVLKETPQVGQEAIELYGKTQDQQSRSESELQRVEAGRRGELKRRLDEFYRFFKAEREARQRAAQKPNP